MGNTTITTEAVSEKLRFAGVPGRGFKLYEMPKPKHQKLDQMTPAMLETAVREIIGTSSTEAEIRQRIVCELGYFEEVNILIGFPVDTLPGYKAPVFHGNRMKNSLTAVVMVILWHQGSMVVV